jgi:hypothetical protein
LGGRAQAVFLLGTKDAPASRLYVFEVAVVVHPHILYKLRL